MNKLNRIAIEKITSDLYGFNEDSDREFDKELTKAIDILEGIELELDHRISNEDSDY